MNTTLLSTISGITGYSVIKLLGLDDDKYTIGTAGIVAGLCASSVAVGSLIAKVANQKKTLNVKSAPGSGSHMMSREEFTAVFNDLNRDLVQQMTNYEMTEHAKQHMKRMLDYNVPKGKLNRGLTVVHTAAAIKGSPLNEKERKLASVLGWCIEWMQASFLVSDDIMDSSITRRGQPCWYRVEDVGLASINDALFLLTQIELLLRKYFGEYEEYMLLHDLITETTYQTELGQLLDLTTQPINGDMDLNLYTAERHTLIVKYKTAFYSFYAPIALGMIVSGVSDQASLDKAREICVKMGIYFQVQDDYLDCYASPEVLGKIGTDIQDKKCGWLVVQALKRATDKQRKIIEDNYGIDDEQKINNIKQLYLEMNLEQLYFDYEEKVYKELTAEIDTVNTVPKAIFTKLLHKIYKRQK